MQTYKRIDIRKRTKELTDIEFGKKRQRPETIQLYFIAKGILFISIYNAPISE